MRRLFQGDEVGGGAEADGLQAEAAQGATSRVFGRTASAINGWAVQDGWRGQRPIDAAVRRARGFFFRDTG